MNINLCLRRGLVALCLVSACDDGAAADSDRTGEIISNLLEAGYPRDDLDVDDDGRVTVQGDIAMSLRASREQRAPQTRFRQYFTTNKVARCNRAIKVLVDEDLDAEFRARVAEALVVWNSVGSGLSFSLTDEFGEQDVWIWGSNEPLAPGVLALSLPPEGGLPGESIAVGPLLLSQSPRFQKHTMIHEIGHTVGLRHTDFNSRASCSKRENEGAGDVGAEWIEGTSVAHPSDTQSPDPLSMFNACSSRTAPPIVFSPDDVLAILTVYPR
ncbi:MAG: M57 family metalloprotease [Myxococcota bacterium]